MPRVTFVKSARKDNPVAKKGESYYWWKFRYGGKRYSKTPPRPSQLTQSAYFGALRSLVETIEDSTPEDTDDFESLQQEVRDELENIQSECQGNLDNMPDTLQYSPTGELLQERVDACDNALSEIDMVDEFEFEETDFDDEYDEDDFEDEDEREEKREEHNREQDEARYAAMQEWVAEQKDTLICAVQDAEV